MLLTCSQDLINLFFFSLGSCLLAGHSTCCVIADDESCLGSDGICYCDAQCYDIGDCCIDIAILNCGKMHYVKWSFVY